MGVGVGVAVFVAPDEAVAVGEGLVPGFPAVGSALWAGDAVSSPSLGDGDWPGSCEAVSVSGVFSPPIPEVAPVAPSVAFPAVAEAPPGVADVSESGVSDGSLPCAVFSAGAVSSAPSVFAGGGATVCSGGSTKTPMQPDMVSAAARIKTITAANLVPAFTFQPFYFESVFFSRLSTKGSGP